MGSGLTDLVPRSAQKRTLRRDLESSRILTSTWGSENASRTPRRLPAVAASKSAFAFAGTFGLGGGEGIMGPPDLGLRASAGEESWRSCVATTRGIEREEREWEGSAGTSGTTTGRSGREQKRSTGQRQIG